MRFARKAEVCRVKMSHTHHMALFTANFDRLRDFYTTVLGFPIVGQNRGRL